MNYSIKADATKKIRYKLVLLYLLNITDLVFTLLLIKTGLFDEANLIVKELLRNPMLCFLVKGLVPGLLIALLIKRIKEASHSQLKVSNLLVNIMLAVYLIINLQHIVWLIIVSQFN